MFAVEGVNSVFFGSDFITITKAEELDWQVLKPMILGAITDHYNSGEEIITDSTNLKKTDEINENQNDPDSQIFSLNISKIENVSVDDKKIIIRVRFISEQFKNNDENTTIKKEDIWTFEKLIQSKDPNWLLSST